MSISQKTRFVLWILYFPTVGETSCETAVATQGQDNCVSLPLLVVVLCQERESLIFPEEPCQAEAANRIWCVSKLLASLLIPWPELFKVPNSLHTRRQQWLPPFHANQAPVLDSLCYLGLCRICHFHLFWQDMWHPDTQPCLLSFIQKGTASIRPTSTTKILAEINWFLQWNSRKCIRGTKFSIKH